MNNVRKQAYPAMWVTAGLHDPRVPYWEAAKWVQRVREANTAPTKVLLRTNMDAGHVSSSDRYTYLRELSRIQAFVLMSLGYEV
jgi:oligopeptidase B